MSELEDRQDATPAIDPATTPMTPAPAREADGSADDHEALAAVEGVDAPAEEGADTEVKAQIGAEPAAAIEADATEAKPSIDAEQVEATAVLVLEDEPVALMADPGASVEPPAAPAIDWVASITEVEPDELASPAPALDWAASVPAAELSELAATDDDDLPLLDDELEHGIASVFAALHSAAQRGDIGESDEPLGPLGETEAIDGITFRLLGELDRLWHRAA